MRNQGMILVIALSCLIIAGVFIYVSQCYIPEQKKKYIADVESQNELTYVCVVKAQDGLPIGTQITEDLFKEGSMSLDPIPAKNVPRNSKDEMLVWNNKDQEALKQTLLNKITANKIGEGSIVTYKDLGEGGDINVNHLEREIQLDVKNSVGDYLKTGKYVDVIVTYMNGEYDVVLSKKAVDRVVTTGVAQASVDNSTSADGTTQTTSQSSAITDAVILVSVTDSEYRDIELAKRMGNLSIRLYKSPEQYASLKTFNYYDRQSQISGAIRQNELKGEQDKYYEVITLDFFNNKFDVDEKAVAYVYSQEYSDLYLDKISSLIEGKQIVETRKQENGKGKISIDSLADTLGITKVDVVLALIFGNKQVQGVDRQTLYNKVCSSGFKTTTGIRRSVADSLVYKVLQFYMDNANKNIDSMAYMIKNRLAY